MTQLELELEWITNPEWQPKEVRHHSNKEGDRFDQFFLAMCGYKEGDTVKYSTKKGKTTIGGNPFMNEGI